MANINVTNGDDLIAAIKTLNNNGNTTSDNIYLQNDIVLTPAQILPLFMHDANSSPPDGAVPLNAGPLRFRSLQGSTTNNTLTVTSALDIYDSSPTTAQPSFAIGPFNLQIGDGTANGSLSGNLRVDDGGYLIFNRSVDTTYTGTLSVEDSPNGLINNFAGTTVTLDASASTATAGLAIRASQGTGAADAYSLEIGGAGNGVISGIIGDGGTAAKPGTLTKTGAGTWTFSGNNTYGGVTTVAAGVLKITSATGLGSALVSGGTAAAAGTTVADGATLQLQNGSGTGIAIGQEALTLAGTGVTLLGAAVGALYNSGGINSFAGDITLASASLITSSGTGSLTLSGAINATSAGTALTLGGKSNGTVSGAIGSNVSVVAKEGSGTWTLSGTNTFTGGITLTDGTLELGTLASAGTGDVAFGSSSETLQIDTSGTLANTLRTFGVGDAVDLRSIDSDGATLMQSGTTVTVTESASVGMDSNTITFGSLPSGYKYALQSDGQGGTNVVLVDGTPPDQPDAPDLTTASDSGTSHTDDLTNVVRPTFTGTTEAGATVNLYENNTLLGTTTANTSGVYFVTTDDDLSEGDHTVSVTATDANDNTSIASPGLTITIDTTAPDAPAAPTLTASSDTGAADGVTSDTTPTFTGTVGANEQVTLYNGNDVVGTGTANSNGVYTIDTNALSEGAYDISAKVTDAAGNTSDSSDTTHVVIDTTTPATPDAPTLVASSDTGLSKTDGVTRDATPTITGTAEPGSTVTLYNGDSVLGTTVAYPGGKYYFTPSDLDDGTYTIKVTSTDGAGNVSDRSAGFKLTIDTTAPSAPAAPTLTTTSDTGRSHTDGYTSDSEPSLTGTVGAGEKVTLYDGYYKIVGSTFADENGDYTVSSGSALTDGVHNLRVRATDAAGNVSARSGATKVIVDTSNPDVIIDGDDHQVFVAQQTISGTGEAYSYLTLYDNGNYAGGVRVGKDGTWSKTIHLQDTDDNEINATALDKAGNAGTSNTIVLDYDPPSGFAGAAAASPHAASAHAGLASALFDAAFTPGHAEVPQLAPHAADLTTGHLSVPAHA